MIGSMDGTEFFNWRVPAAAVSELDPGDLEDQRKALRAARVLAHRAASPAELGEWLAMLGITDVVRAARGAAK